MVRLRRANADTMKDVDIVVIGVPDESNSHAKRKGTSRAPDIMRIASNDSEFFERGGMLIPTYPMSGSLDRKSIFDAGNISDKHKLRELVTDITLHGKLPIMIGGDHSLSTEAIHAVSNAIGKKLSLLYFDAHPDFVSSTTNYYGSVLSDSTQFLNFRKSMLIGTRAAEPEELENAEKVGLSVISPLEVVELGIKRIAQMIRARTRGSKIYVSVDLDCIDPAFAPGVSVPSPGGLSSIDLIYLLNKTISTGNVVAVDIVELAPDYDINNTTAMLAARIMSECIASF
ncbi:MAG: arginase family protein [Thermoproteota archaeon]|nr:arginase family protein [Thermoproteota archaeon]